jgi:hypothetical protein
MSLRSVHARGRPVIPTPAVPRPSRKERPTGETTDSQKGSDLWRPPALSVRSTLRAANLEKGKFTMPMSQASILVGKCYRTPEDELRQVKALEEGEVVFTAVSSTHGVGLISKVADQRLSLARFAEEAESEVREKA